MKHNIEKLTSEHLKDIKYIIFDCDGVLWNGNNLVMGTIQLLEKLNCLQIKFILLTNNSTKSKDQYLAKCLQLGLPVSIDNIVCTSSLAVSYLKKINFEGKLYMIGSKGLSKELEMCGINHTPPGKETCDIEDMNEFNNVILEPGITGVLVGFDPHFSFVKLMRAASHIRATGLFIATNEDAQFPTSSSSTTVIPGTGSIVSAVTKASGVQPIVLGKPNPFCLEAIRIAHPWLEPSHCLMVGDRLDTDICFGNHCAMHTLLVMTGVTTHDQLQDVEENHRPHCWAASVKELLECL